MMNQSGAETAVSDKINLNKQFSRYGNPRVSQQ
jgi:hypothetical protein